MGDGTVLVGVQRAEQDVEQLGPIVDVELDAEWEPGAGRARDVEQELDAEHIAGEVDGQLAADGEQEDYESDLNIIQCTV